MKALRTSPVSLVSSTAPEADYPAWAAGTYAAGARVIRATTHRIYERQVGGASTSAPEVDAAWLDVGPTNRWAMFDKSPSFATVSAASPLAVVLTASAVVTDIVLAGIVGATVTITSNGATVRTATVPAARAPALFSTLTVSGLSIPAGAQIGVSVSGVGVSVGQLLVGSFLQLGETLEGARLELADFSAVETNNFGVTTIVPRPYSRRLSCTVRVPAQDIDRVTGALDDLDGQVVFWVLEEAFECMSAVGWYKDWTKEVPGPAFSTYSITIEGLARDDVAIAPGAGNLTATEPVSSAVATIVTGGVRIAWAPAEDLAIVTEWRIGASWAAGSRIFRGQATDCIWLAPPLGTHTAWAVNTDQFGAPSAAVSMTITVGESALIAWATLAGRPADADILNSQAAFSAVRAWTFQGTTDGCVAQGATLTASASSVTLASTGGDPILITGGALGISGANFSRVRARLRRLAGSSWQGTVYYITDAHGVSESYTKTIADQTAAGAWVVLEWDMAALTAGGADWTSATIQQLRLDLGNSAADVFELDWIAVGTVGPSSYGAVWGLNVIGSAAVDQAVASAAQTAANAASAASAGQISANAALARLQAIDSDGILARGEKGAVIVDWTELWNSRVGIIDSATAYGIPSADFSNALSALSNHLLSLSLGWSDTSQDTTIIPATWRTLWDAAYQARTALLNAIAARAKYLADTAQQTGANAATAAAAALSQLQAIASNGILSRGEKPDVITRWNELWWSVDALLGTAAALSITTERTNAETRRAELANLLTSLSPGWSDTSADSTIVPATWNAAWDAAYQARAALQARIGVVSASIADWSKVTGRPSNVAGLIGNEDINNAKLGQASNLINCQTEMAGNSTAGWSLGSWVAGMPSTYQGAEMAREPSGIWCPVGANPICLAQGAPATTAHAWTFGGQYPGGNATFSVAFTESLIPVSPATTKRVCGSAWVAHHRCGVDLYVEFKRADGSVTGGSMTNSPGEVGGGRSLTGWRRLAVFADVPADAVSMRLLFAKRNTAAGQTSSYGWMVMPMIEVAGPLQEVPSTYSPSAATSHSQLGAVNTADIAAGAVTISAVSIHNPVTDTAFATPPLALYETNIHESIPFLVGSGVVSVEWNASLVFSYPPGTSTGKGTTYYLAAWIAEVRDDGSTLYEGFPRTAGILSVHLVLPGDATTSGTIPASFKISGDNLGGTDSLRGGAFMFREGRRYKFRIFISVLGNQTSLTHGGSWSHREFKR